MARLLAVLFVFVCMPALAAPEVPDTAAGRVFSAWMTMFDSADRAQAEAFVQRHGGEPVEDTLAYRDFSGGLDLLRVDQSEPLRLRALLRERDSAQADVQVTLELESPSSQRLKNLAVEPQPVARLGEAEALAALAARANAFAAEDRFSGVWLVARHGRVLQQQALGLADREAKAPLTPQSRLRFASLGKMFTAIAVLQLVEAGKLSLDGTVGDYLADYPDREVAAKVRIRHLLAHTGGTGGIGLWNSEEFKTQQDFIAYRDAMKTHADYVRHHAGNGLAFEPGSKMEYSNHGYILLGRLIEQASGMSYYDYVDEKVLKPAQMTATGFEPESVDVPRRAKGYMRKDGRWVANPGLLPYRGMAAGGGYTTVGDMLRFARALQSGKLLSKELFAEAVKSQNDEGWYGFGFIVVGEGPLRRYGHAGDFPGMNADFRVFPESRYVLVVLSNLDSPAAYRLFRFYEPRMPVGD